MVTGMEQVLNWGLKNGRAALNEKLMEKYGMNLDMADTDNLESVSQIAP